MARCFMEFSTLGRASILFAVLAACGGNGTASSGQQTTTTNGDPGGPFVAQGSSGPFAAVAGATTDLSGRYGNGGPFVSQGASGPFGQPGSIAGDCAAACQRAASFACAPVQGNAQPPAGAAGSSSSDNRGSGQLDSCLQDCNTLDALQSDCLRNIISGFVACVLRAPLTCDRNGEVQVEGCAEPDVKICGGTVTQTQVPDQTNTGPAVGDGGR